METESKYLKKIRDALLKKIGKTPNSPGPNTKAKYLNDISSALDEWNPGGGGGTGPVIVHANPIDGDDSHVLLDKTYTEIRALAEADKEVIIAINGKTFAGITYFHMHNIYDASTVKNSSIGFKLYDYYNTERTKDPNKGWTDNQYKIIIRGNAEGGNIAEYVVEKYSSSLIPLPGNNESPGQVLGLDYAKNHAWINQNCPSPADGDIGQILTIRLVNGVKKAVWETPQ